MLYRAYQAFCDLMAPPRAAAAAALALREGAGGYPLWPLDRNWAALLDLLANSKVTHKPPPFAVPPVPCGNRLLEVREEVILSLPFGDLLHFAKDDDAPKPRMLVVAPLSGHFPTLLRGTVTTLLRDHDVYITNWANARDVPLSDGDFGFDDYVDYLIRFIEALGPGTNLLAVCQPCVQALVAAAVMAADDHPAQPRTMTLMGGPIDTRIAPTVVDTLAMSKPLDWFARNLISQVPWRHRGAGRAVYPGFLQLTAFLSMNVGRHLEQHRELYRALAEGDQEKSARIKGFYEEYFAVLDLDGQFYLETIDRVFQRALLPRGLLEHRGRKVDPAAIRKTALLTVEGERDDICAVGQTSVAHELCSSLRPHLKRHHLQPGVGHYGVFSGGRWERQVYPQVRNMVLAMA